MPVTYLFRNCTVPRLLDLERPILFRVNRDVLRARVVRARFVGREDDLPLNDRFGIVCSS